MQYLAERSKPAGRAVQLHPDRDYSVAFAHGRDDFLFVVNALAEQDLIKRTDLSNQFMYRVTMKGYERLQERAPSQVADASQWPKVNAAIADMRKRLQETTSDIQARSVGHLCGQVLVALADAVHDPAKHPSIDGVEPSPTDSKRRLAAYVSAALSGSSYSEERNIARDVITFAHEVIKFADGAKHDQNATPLAAAICAEATLAVVTVVRLIASKPDDAGAGVAPHEWLEQEARFKALKGHSSAIWLRDEGASELRWNVTPMTGSSTDDLRAFRTEAVLAGKLLARAGLVRGPRDDPEDDWLNAVRVLAESETGMILSGSTDGRRHEGRAIDNLEWRSALACAMLAGGARPELS